MIPRFFLSRQRSSRCLYKRDYVFIDTLFSKPEVPSNKLLDIDLPSSDLPRAEYVDGGYRCPWSYNSKKSIKDVSQMLYEKITPVEPFLGHDDTSKTLRLKSLDFAKLSQKSSSATWLGHSTCLFRMDGIGLLTDPVWNKTVGPPIISNLFGPNRLVNTPCSVSNILPVVDIVLVSHSHYDHLDLDTAKIIGNQKLWIVPMGVKEVLADIGINNCIELNWWESYTAEIAEEKIEVTLTPTKHWSARTFYDRNKSLWGSFVMSSGSHKFFFGGDTAYCSAFKKIGEKYGPFDISAIPIGAYKPRWFLKDVHCDPLEAVQIHKDIKSKKSFAIHWGTFPLASEDHVEPALELAKAREDLKVSADEFFTLSHGGSYFMNENESAAESDYATTQQPKLYELFLKSRTVETTTISSASLNGDLQTNL